MGLGGGIDVAAESVSAVCVMVEGVSECVSVVECVPGRPLATAELISVLSGDMTSFVVSFAKGRVRSGISAFAPFS